jgi:hypothetical protein
MILSKGRVVFYASFLPSTHTVASLSLLADC